MIIHTGLLLLVKRLTLTGGPDVKITANLRAEIPLLQPQYQPLLCVVQSDDGHGVDTRPGAVELSAEVCEGQYLVVCCRDFESQ